MPSSQGTTAANGAAEHLETGVIPCRARPKSRSGRWSRVRCESARSRNGDLELTTDRSPTRRSQWDAAQSSSCKGSMRSALSFVVAGCMVCAGVPTLTRADAGPLGIDRRITYDDSGIWKRRNQVALEVLAPLVVASGALWLGDDEPL